MRALKKKGAAGPMGPQQARGSGMSHVTRMGLTPGLTQLLSDLVQIRRPKRPSVSRQPVWVPEARSQKPETAITHRTTPLLSAATPADRPSAQIRAPHNP